jgi:hypothetical protein
VEYTSAPRILLLSVKRSKLPPDSLVFFRFSLVFSVYRMRVMTKSSGPAGQNTSSQPCPATTLNKNVENRKKLMLRSGARHMRDRFFS